MIARLAEIRKSLDPIKLSFLSDQRAALLKSMIERATNSSETINLRYSLAETLTEAGDPEAALEQFKLVLDLAGSLPHPVPEKWEAGFRLSKAIALMRLGEQENCLRLHNAESCLFPLQPAAFHTVKRGSSGAVEILTEQLTKHPDDLGARWLMNIASMTLGDYPDKVPAQWVIPPKVFESDYPLPRFPNVAGALGLDIEGLAGGCILDDFDNDGFIDIVVSSMHLDSQLRYFHNDGSGHFTERTIAAGLQGLPGGLNIQQTDYNNDGLLDIWVERGGWYQKQGRIPGSLLRNNGDGTFTDVTEQAGLLRSHPSQTCVWFDYDGDGWLDLFKGNESSDPADPDPCELFHNNRDGTFTECAARCGLDVKGVVKGATSADYDHDGRPDLYLSILGLPNKLLHNDGPDGPGQWKFSEVTARAGVSEPILSFPTWFFDYDNDGWEDLFVSGYRMGNLGDIAADYLGLPNTGTTPKLYHNNHDGTFTDVTKSAGLNHVLLTMGCNFGDLDNDGWLDFYLGTGEPGLGAIMPNRMYRNANGKLFQDVTTAGGFGHLQKGHAVGFADLDNDGDQDVFMVLGGAYPGDLARSALFLNPGNQNHWLKLKLEGTRSNRAAIGARIKVNVKIAGGARSIYKTVNSGGSFGSSPLRQEIGLGDASEVTSVEVFWPASGIHQTLSGFALDHAYRIRENRAEPVAWELKRIEFESMHPHAHAH
jgi:ASPIC and UnbV/FG-GAP-like repeat